MKYIETFRDGERVADIYLCKQKTSAVTKNGKAYENLRDKLADIGVENASGEARQIIYHASGLSPLAVSGAYSLAAVHRPLPAMASQAERRL